MSGWALGDIPERDAHTAVATGGNIGLGFGSALELARKGARVFIARRSPNKGIEAAACIRAAVPPARLDTIALDLTDPASIERFAAKVTSRIDRRDLLLKNAGAVNLEALQRMPAGHEMHMATNHCGHLALRGICSKCLSRRRARASSP